MIRLLISLLPLIILNSCKHPDAKYLSNSQSEEKSNNDFSSTSIENILNSENNDSITINNEISGNISAKKEQNALPMERKDGVTYVWIEVNRIPLKFIFDTGASSIFISPAEALVLVKQGTLDENDIIGKQNYQDATGGISEGTIINLKEVKIGNKVLKNIQASVSDNIDSPLLLGQSALSRFGKVSIDYNKNIIILE
ncbi:retropepsin-like aspartic protease family protein [Chryseobacterium sp. T1]